jgi:hypothetical protein
MAAPAPIRIGILGCAAIAARSVGPAIRSVPGLTLAGVASRSADKGREFAARLECAFFGSYADLVARDDIDAIYMPLPTGLHAEWAAKALQAGKHLLVEKSLAATLPEAETLVDLARRNRRVMMENYMFEYHAQQAAVRAIIRERLGALRLFRAVFCFPPLAPGNFRYDPALGGGALLDAGGYPLKACQIFAEGDIMVQATCLNGLPGGVDLWGGAMLTASASGQVVPLQIAFGFDQFYQCGIEALGQHGRLTTFRTFTAGPGFTPTALLETPNGKEEIPLPADNHFARLLEIFQNRIAAGDFESPCRENLRQARLQHDVRRLARPSQEPVP